MNCPECDSDTKVIDSRTNGVVRRRRQCKNCDYKFSTEEQVVMAFSRDPKPRPNRKKSDGSMKLIEPKILRLQPGERLAPKPNARRRIEELTELRDLEDDFDYLEVDTDDDKDLEDLID